MRAIRVASAALLGVTALTLTAPEAVASDGTGNNITSFGFSVLPTTIAAGGHVTLSVTGCNQSATVSSGVFDPVTIPRGRGSATAMVDWDAKPGAVYDVTFQCGHETGIADLAIATGRTNPTPAPVPVPVPVPQGVQAGEGGSIAGFDLKEIGLGAALIAGSLGTAWYLTRRRAADDKS